MPLLEVTLVQNYASQQCINRFNYVASGTPASVSYSYGLVYALGAIETGGIYPPTGLMQLLADIQAPGVTFQGLTAFDVYSETDFYSHPFAPPLTGGAGVSGATPANAYGFRSTRVRRDIRRGQKRFVGVAPALVDDEGVLEPGNAGIEAVRVALGATLNYDDEGNTITYQPAIVAKQRYEVDGDPDRIAYRYYPPEEGGEAEQLLNTATGIAWETLPTVRTQRSRQYGVGM